jgi:WD40 repeat protein
MPIQHLGPIAGIAASPQWIATAGYDNRLILWDKATRSALQLAHHDHLVNQCAFSSDGQWLVSASSDYSARIWSLPDLKLQAVLSGHTDDVDMAAFSPDDTLIATCALDRCVRIFLRNGQCLHTMQGHTGNVLSLAWSHDGQYVVTSSVDGTIRTWSARTGQQTHITDLGIRSDSVEMTRDGRIFAGDDHGRIALIENNTLHFIQAHQAGVKKIALNEDLGILVSLSYDRTMAIWQISQSESHSQLQEISRTELPACIWARAATILDDGRIACGTFGSTYALFDPSLHQWNLDGVAAGNALNTILVQGGDTYSVGDAGTVLHNGVPYSEMGSLCNFLVASGAHLFCGGQLGQIFDAHRGIVLYQHHSPLNCAAVLQRHGQTHLAVGTYTGEILIFEVQPLGTLTWAHTLELYENAVKGISVTANELFSVCANTDIAWHNITDWGLRKRITRAHERIANGCCVLNEGGFASVGRDLQLRLWRDGEHSSYRTPHRNSVKCIGANEQGSAVLTGSYGGTVARFDLHTRQWGPLQRLTHAGISAITWDAHNQQFLASSYDGRIYPVAA